MMKILLVSWDNRSQLHLFPMSLGAIAAVLVKAGYEVEVYNQDMHHYPDEHLTKYLDDNTFDFVAVSVIAGYYEFACLLRISEAINNSSNRPVYMLGGYGPSPEPEYFLKKTGADAVCIGEGDETILDLVNAFANKRPLSDVLGIAYMDGGTCKVNDRRPLIEDLDSLPWTPYELFPMEYYRLYSTLGSSPTDFTIPMMSGRGCTFRCSFCYRIDTGYRARDPKSLADEIEYLNKEFGITFITFKDDLLMTSVSATEAICKELIKLRKKGINFRWNCNGRLNYCTRELIELMKEAGCVFINYGIEAMDNEVLKNMKKGLRTDQVIKGVEMTLDVGISPGLNFMFGNIGDNRQTIQNAVDFLLKYDDFTRLSSIRPVTPYPGSPLYYDAIEKGLLGGVEDFYENKHVNSDLLCVNFTELSDDEVYDCLREANLEILNHHHAISRERTENIIDSLYLDRDASFRGFRGGAKDPSQNSISKKKTSELLANETH